MIGARPVALHKPKARKVGGVYVVVADAREGFARWLKRTGNGSSGYPSGVVVYAKTNSQSVERATAYAENFARVLRRNGKDVRVTKYLT